MQSQRHPSGMFDQYLQDDSSSGQYQRYDSDASDYEAEDDLTNEAESMPADGDESKSTAAMKPGLMHAKHMEMMCEMMHMMQEMLGMFSNMLQSAPKQHKEPVDKSEDE